MDKPAEQLGFDKPPDRYTRSGRETIDLIRDSMTDTEFTAYCKGQVIRYKDREGLKDSDDLNKAHFYHLMYLHMLDGGKDPRAYREGFQDYIRRPFDGTRFGLGVSE